MDSIRWLKDPKRHKEWCEGQKHIKSNEWHQRYTYLERVVWRSKKIVKEEVKQFYKSRLSEKDGYIIKLWNIEFPSISLETLEDYKGRNSNGNKYFPYK